LVFKRPRLGLRSKPVATHCLDLVNAQSERLKAAEKRGLGPLGGVSMTAETALREAEES
jgi:hypothetical protein